MDEHKEKAVFAGGCFWCMVKPFDQWDGVYSVTSGYTGGHIEKPTYEQVKEGNSGHYEEVEIVFDSSKISYELILDLYWKQIDPTDSGGQFHDRGPQYRTAIFYQNEEQKRVAEQSKRELEQSGRFKQPIVTEILKASTFYPAEEEHQYFYKKNEEHYLKDRAQSGRDEFINQNWN
ncbi:peptide-methionine (S)-S-oxide reductase MsrA [Allobacillus sp. GCM10007491]|uniref:Peptide methionine sulfoxide reductase MsrA n=1 Tax=Allobacillus saliphilus TaxID=2912308 RepID=A0A941CU66_9BACI|nr:peptide-methionine (S)-S-oxide reductase MsrA [Allobacillus saliphilus]MBR7553191.1 peptide-methionine (S)-S-oxide reductase MsrA [Allobacillus saliphilus]